MRTGVSGGGGWGKTVLAILGLCRKILQGGETRVVKQRTGMDSALKRAKKKFRGARAGFPRWAFGPTADQRAGGTGDWRRGNLCLAVRIENVPVLSKSVAVKKKGKPEEIEGRAPSCATARCRRFRGRSQGFSPM